MAVAHCAYLFDVENFRTTINPVIKHPLADEFDALHTLAVETSNHKPHIWKIIMEDYRADLSDLECEEPYFDFEAQVRFWMMIVLAGFWQPLDQPPKAQMRYAASIRAAMRLAGKGEDIITELIRGKTTCALLQPQLVTDPINQRQDKNWPFWCYGLGAGWLDRSDIDALLQQLKPLSGFFSGIDRETEKGLDLRPATAYQAAVEMLSAAQRANQGLFLSITD